MCGIVTCAEELLKCINELNCLHSNNYKKIAHPSVELWACCAFLSTKWHSFTIAEAFTEIGNILRLIIALALG